MGIDRPAFPPLGESGKEGVGKERVSITSGVCVPSSSPFAVMRAKGRKERNELAVMVAVK